jgi:hypothetical protein
MKMFWLSSLVIGSSLGAGCPALAQFNNSDTSGTNLQNIPPFLGGGQNATAINTVVQQYNQQLGSLSEFQQQVDSATQAYEAAEQEAAQQMRQFRRTAEDRVCENPEAQRLRDLQQQGQEILSGLQDLRSQYNQLTEGK